jgi:type II restriction/modification system DNA methylase subunit YeeA
MPSHLAHPQLTKLLVGAVERMLVLSPKLRQANSDTERAALENAIRKTDRDIDQLVYQLYGLTPEEIALVEGTADTADVVTEA